MAAETLVPTFDELIWPAIGALMQVNGSVISLGADLR
jgi:hypothetical protein